MAGGGRQGTDTCSCHSFFCSWRTQRRSLQVEQYDGDFDDYKTELIKEITQELDDDEVEIAAKNSAAVVRK